MLPAMKLTHTAALILALCAAPAFAAAPLQNHASVRPGDGCSRALYVDGK